MARLRIKIELNPGGVGIRLDKLAKISEELEKFLRSLAIDCGTPIVAGDWLAKDFYDSSFGSSVEYMGNVETPAAIKFNNGLKFFSNFRNGRLPDEYSAATVKNFIDIGEVIDPDEAIRLGIFYDVEAAGDQSIVWEKITRIETRNVDAVFHEEYRYEGALQGKIGTWYKDSNYFNLREALSGTLIKCFYGADMYDQIYRLYDDKEAVVNISGHVTAERATGQVTAVRVTAAKSYAPLNGAEFRRLFGLAPDLTGDMSSADYIDKMRSDGNA